ncbi:MAG: membrane protein insertase YidC [Nitrospirota bacterium]|jgi:YidC/Oxa1 family membrane protein insertase
MEKKTIIAVVLSVAIIILWQVFFVKPPPPKPVTAQRQAPAVNAAAGEAPAPEPGAAEGIAPFEAPRAEQIVRVATPLYEAEFSSRGGTVRRWTLKDYKDPDGRGVDLLAKGGPYEALALGWQDDFSVSSMNFSVQGEDLSLSAERPAGSLVFTFAKGDVSIRRTYTFHHDTYTVDIKDEVNGVPEYQITLGPDFGIHKKQERYSHVGPAFQIGTELEEVKPKHLKEGPKVFPGQEIKWAAMEDKYFCAALVPAAPVAEGKVWMLHGLPAVSLEGAPGAHSLTLYAGPKSQDYLGEAGADLKNIVNFGFFSILARPIFWLLKWLYGIVGNYGWSIIILTLILRIPFIPLVNKGQRSMRRLQQVQPLMQQIREQYKNDPKRMQAEMMGLYKKHKVNPLGGCLPMIIQIPFFFALYKVLLISIELREAPWAFWIHDLSAKDPYYILPIVMGVSMVVQQKMTPSAGDPKQQKLMMFMPVIFTFLFLNFPSGLVLYWMVNNLLSISQQLYVNLKKTPAPA